MSAPMLERLSTARNRELVNLLFLAVLTVCGFTAVLVARSGAISSTSLIDAAAFLALFAIAHIALRWRLPQADPYLLPLVGILAALGLCEIYRIRPALARDQALWIAIGVAAFVAILVLLPDFRVLERYRYLCGAVALGLLAITIGYSYATHTVINGARVWIRAGGLSFQPAELAKIFLVLFLAGYLRERRELLAQTPTRILGIGLPPLRQLAPLLGMLGAALVLLVAMNDFGTSLLFFGVFVALVYVATGRVAYAVIGLGAFAAGSVIAYQIAPQVAERVTIWLDPWKTPHTTGYQLVQSLYTVANGGLFGAGLGRGYILTGGGAPVIPEVQTDFIYSAIAGELGLAGAAALLLCYVLIAYRGFKIASRAGDGFSKLVATGLTLTLSLQAFLIIGGVVRVVPLTGITLPFVSYGGSSIVSNFVLLALLLSVSDRASRQASLGGRW
jgi:cell division protein FtsW (lipid II flippase)